MRFPTATPTIRLMVAMAMVAKCGETRPCMDRVCGGGDHEFELVMAGAPEQVEKSFTGVTEAVVQEFIRFPKAPKGLCVFWEEDTDGKVHCVQHRHPRKVRHIRTDPSAAAKKPRHIKLKNAYHQGFYLPRL